MNSITLLKEFAKSKNISVEEVNEFLEKYETPRTIEDLVEIPYDMLEHQEYITFVEEPLQTFISDHMFKDRYETIDLDNVLDALEDYKEDAKENKNKNNMKYADKVEKCIIKTKFGSVVYDW